MDTYERAARRAFLGILTIAILGTCIAVAIGIIASLYFAFVA